MNEPNDHLPLSPAGVRQRDQILARTLGELRRRRQRRLAVRGLLGLLLAVGIFTGWRSFGQRPLARVPGRERPTPAPIAIGPHRPSPGRIDVQPRPSTQPAKWGTMNDDELLSQMADAGIAGGFVKIGNRTVLITANGEILHDGPARAVD